MPGPVAGIETTRRLTDEIGEQAWIDAVARRRFGEPTEIGTMAVVSASPLAAYVTGARLEVDGGLALSGSGLVDQAPARKLP